MAQDIFDVAVQERVWKQQFFYNAFRALGFNRISGDYAEFGCWSGSTFWLAHVESRRHQYPARLWAFDSFEGLPPASGSDADHPGWVEGGMRMSLQEFHAACARDGIPRSAYEVVPGFYSDTLDEMTVRDAPTDIALAFIDCDMYESTLSVINFLLPRMKHGMIIAFDDYFCWTASHPSGERRAMLELLGDHDRWNLLPFFRFGWHGQSFVVEDKSRLVPSDC